MDRVIQGVLQALVTNSHKAYCLRCRHDTLLRAYGTSHKFPELLQNRHLRGTKRKIFFPRTARSKTPDPCSWCLGNTIPIGRNQSIDLLVLVDTLRYVIVSFLHIPAIYVLKNLRRVPFSVLSGLLEKTTRRYGRACVSLPSPS